VLPAPTLESILKGNSRRRRQDAGSRLVSILLTTPDTTSFASLRNNIAYFKARSGEAWDLHVAGYYRYFPIEVNGRGLHPDDTPTGLKTGGDSGLEWWFSPRGFDELCRNLERHHGAQSGGLRGRVPWRYSGTPELVSFWVADGVVGHEENLVADEADKPDWDSLVACQLRDDMAVGQVVETHTGWASGPLPREFRPGTRPRAAGQILHVENLRSGLSWVIAGAAGAALSEGVNVLIDELLRR